jgi:hypothetical protein
MEASKNTTEGARSGRFLYIVLLDLNGKHFPAIETERYWPNNTDVTSFNIRHLIEEAPQLTQGKV